MDNENNLYAVTYVDGGIRSGTQNQLFVLANDFDEAVTKFRLKGGMDSMTLLGVQLFAPSDTVLA